MSIIRSVIYGRNKEEDKRFFLSLWIRCDERDSNGCTPLGAVEYIRRLKMASAIDNEVHNEQAVEASDKETEELLDNDEEKNAKDEDSAGSEAGKAQASEGGNSEAGESEVGENAGENVQAEGERLESEEESLKAESQGALQNAPKDEGKLESEETGEEKAGDIASENEGGESGAKSEGSEGQAEAKPLTRQELLNAILHEVRLFNSKVSGSERIDEDFLKLYRDTEEISILQDMLEAFKERNMKKQTDITRFEDSGLKAKEGRKAHDFHDAGKGKVRRHGYKKGRSNNANKRKKRR